MDFESKLMKLCEENGDIEILHYYEKQKIVDVLLPYESSSVIIELQGETEEELIESFKEEVNHRLQAMIDHLEECKF